MLVSFFGAYFYKISLCCYIFFVFAANQVGSSFFLPSSFKLGGYNIIATTLLFKNVLFMPSPPKGKVIAAKNDPPALQQGNLTGYGWIQDEQMVDMRLTKVLLLCQRVANKKRRLCSAVGLAPINRESEQLLSQRALADPVWEESC